MEIALITPKQYREEVMTPLGILYLAAVLEKKGHNVTVLDMNEPDMTIGRLSENLKKIKPPLVGVSSMITDIRDVLRIGATVKETLPGSLVVFGGPLPSSMPGIMIKKPFVDVVVLGEGESTMLELVEAAEGGRKLESVNGIVFKRNGEVVATPPREPTKDLDSIPFPARHLINMRTYLRKKRILLGVRKRNMVSINMISSRGCPYNCIYCFQGVFGRTWRGRSAKNVVDEMELLHKDYGVEGIVFSDDTFVLDRKRVFGICHEIKKRKLKVKWFCNARANLVDFEMLKEMKSAGCIQVAFGIESGNKKILELMRKGATKKQVANAVRMAKKAGLYTMGFFMVGMIGESPKEMMDTIEFARKLGLDFASFSITTTHPTTALETLAKEYGKLPKNFRWDNVKDYFHISRNVSNVSNDDLMKMYWMAGQIPKLSPNLPTAYLRIYYEYASLRYYLIHLYRNMRRGDGFSKSVSKSIRSYLASECKHFPGGAQ